MTPSASLGLVRRAEVPSPSFPFLPMRETRERDRLQGALIGFGNMAERGHLPGWLRQRRVRLRAVCDPRPERRRRAGRLLPSARIYASAEELLAEEHLDFVDVCTPPPSHAALTVMALRRGAHVLCEKPFVSNRREFRSVLAAVERSQRIAFPVHNWRHAPMLARAIDWVRRGLIGKVIHSEIHTLRTRPAVGLTAWRERQEEAGGGGILLDHGWHGIYLLLDLHRQLPRAVSTWTRPSLATPGRTEHTTHLLLDFPDSTGTLFLTWQANRRHNALRVYGDKGLITLEDDRLVLRPAAGRTRVATYRAPLSRGSHHPEWFDGVVKRFLAALEDPEEGGKGLREASLCLEIILRAYASARANGRPVGIPSPHGADRR